MINFPIREIGESYFHPFHLLIDAVEETLSEMNKYQLEGSAFALPTILLSALAIEALANSIGSYKVTNWSKKSMRSSNERSFN
jgi:hypothetical protein